MQNSKTLEKYHFQTIFSVPRVSNSFLKKYFGAKKVYSVSAKSDLKKIEFSGLIGISFQADLYAVPAILISLERLFEENFSKVKLILIFEQNIKTERIFKQIKDSYFLRRTVYLPWQKTSKKPISAKPLFEKLTENQQIIVQQLVFNKFNELLFNPEETKHLLKTGIVNSKYQIIFPGLIQFIRKKFPVLELSNLSGLSLFQQKGLNLLIKNSGKIVPRDKLAACLWGRDFIYSDYALDQFISRLRNRLKTVSPSPSLIAIKKQGFIFIPYKNQQTHSFQQDNLTFKALVPVPQVINFYYRFFQNPQTRQYLFRFTPKGKSQISTWLTNLVNNPAFFYFSIFQSNHLVGHIGLKYINHYQKTASIGTFVKNKSMLEKHGVDIYRFILKQAKKLGLKTVSKDVSQYPEITIGVLAELRFRRVFGSLWKKKIC